MGTLHRCCGSSTLQITEGSTTAVGDGTTDLIVRLRSTSTSAHNGADQKQHAVRSGNHTAVFSASPDLADGLDVKAVPEWLKLAYIQRGYRVGGSYGSCMRSLFSWHNQTLNLWTMIINVLVSSLLLWGTLAAHPALPTGPAAAFISLWFSAAVHAPFSVGFHQFMPISQSVMLRWRALDITFIFIGSVFLTFSLAYFVLPAAVTGMLTTMSACLAVYAAYAAPRLKAGVDIDKGANARLVAMTVVVYWSPMVCAALHEVWTRGVLGTAGTSALGVAASLGLGTWLYVKSFPDKYFPGVFDYVGATQQLMHVCVGLAHMFEWRFLLHAYQQAQAPPQP